MEQLTRIGKSLGIDFVDPDQIVAQLCEEQGMSYVQLIIWLQTKEAREYIARVYGHSLKLPGLDV